MANKYHVMIAEEDEDEGGMDESINLLSTAIKPTIPRRWFSPIVITDLINNIRLPQFT